MVCSIRFIVATLTKKGSWMYTCNSVGLMHKISKHPRCSSPPLDWISRRLDEKRPCATLVVSKHITANWDAHTRIHAKTIV